MMATPDERLEFNNPVTVVEEWKATSEKICLVAIRP
jgi:hypothetical protein